MPAQRRFEAGRLLADGARKLRSWIGLRQCWCARGAHSRWRTLGAGQLRAAHLIKGGFGRLLALHIRRQRQPGRLLVRLTVDVARSIETLLVGNFSFGRKRRAGPGKIAAVLHADRAAARRQREKREGVHAARGFRTARGFRAQAHVSANGGVRAKTNISGAYVCGRSFRWGWRWRWRRGRSARQFRIIWSIP